MLMLIAAVLLCSAGGYSLHWRSRSPAVLPFSICMFLCAAWAVIDSFESYNLILALFMAAGALFIWVLFHQQIQKVTPVARSAVIKSMSDLMLIVDPLDHLIDFNPTAIKILGIERLKIGLPLGQVLAGWDEFLHLYHSAPLSAGEFRVIKGDQPTVYEFSTSVMQDKKGHFAGRLLLFRDITSRKQDEEKLRASEQRFRLMVHVAPTPLVLTRVGDNVILYVNEKAAELFGTSSYKLVGHSTLELYVSPNEHMKLAEEVMKNAAVYDRELLLKRQNGDHFWGLVSAAVTPTRTKSFF